MEPSRNASLFGKAATPVEFDRPKPRVTEASTTDLRARPQPPPQHEVGGEGVPRVRRRAQAALAAVGRAEPRMALPDEGGLAAQQPALLLQPVLQRGEVREQRVLRRPDVLHAGAAEPLRRGGTRSAPRPRAARRKPAAGAGSARAGGREAKRPPEESSARGRIAETQRRCRDGGAGAAAKPASGQECCSTAAFRRERMRSCPLPKGRAPSPTRRRRSGPRSLPSLTAPVHPAAVASTVKSTLHPPHPREVARAPSPMLRRGPRNRSRHRPRAHCRFAGGHRCAPPDAARSGRRRSSSAPAPNPAPTSSATRRAARRPRRPSPAGSACGAPSPRAQRPSRISPATRPRRGSTSSTRSPSGRATHTPSAPPSAAAMPAMRDPSGWSSARSQPRRPAAAADRRRAGRPPPPAPPCRPRSAPPSRPPEP